MSIPILRHSGASINLTKIADSFRESSGDRSTRSFYVVDLPRNPVVDAETWMKSLFGPPSATEAIIVPDDVKGLAARALPGTAVYAYGPDNWSVRRHFPEPSAPAAHDGPRTVLLIPPYITKAAKKGWPVTLLDEVARELPGVLGPAFGHCVFRTSAPEFLRHIDTMAPEAVAGWLADATRRPADAVLVPDELARTFREVRRHMVTDLPFAYYNCTGFTALLEDGPMEVPDFT